MTFSRKLLLISAFILLLGIIACFIAWHFTGKAYFLNLLNKELDSKVGSGAHVRDVSLHIWSTFPSVGLHAEDVLARDLSDIQDTAVYVQHLYLSISIGQLLSGYINPEKVILENGFIRLHQDSLASEVNGRSFGSASSNSFSIPSKVLLKNFSFDYHDFKKGKNIRISALKSHIKPEQSSDTLLLKINGEFHIHQLEFNPRKGSFLTNCPVEGELQICLYPNRMGLFLSGESLKLGLNKDLIKASLSIDSLQTLSIKSEIKSIDFEQALRFLNPYLVNKLNGFKAVRLLDVSVDISAQKGASQPTVQIDWKLNKDSLVQIKNHPLKMVSVSASFTNQSASNKPPSDANTQIRLKDLTALWKGLTFTAPEVSIQRLDTILLSGTVNSQSDLSKASNFIKSSTVGLLGGKVNVDVKFQTTIFNHSTRLDYIDGKAWVDHASILYKPKELKIRQIHGELEFRKTSLKAKNIRCAIGDNRFRANVEAKHLLSFLNSTPENAQINLEVFCHDLNLNSILQTLGTASKSATKVEYTELPVMRKIDKVLQHGSMKLKLKAGSLELRNFSAQNVQADIQTSPGKWQLNRMTLLHGDGNIHVRGSIVGNRSDENDLDLFVEMNNLDVQKLFHDFENFGQNVINHQQIKGNLKSTVRLTGKINSALLPVRESLQGSLIVRLKDGQLIEFAPVMDLQNFLMKNRDFRNVTFSELSDTILIHKGNMNFSNLVIHSNLLKMEMNGFYDLGGATDMYLRIPVSNLSRIDPEALSQVTDTARIEGVSVYLHAVSDDQGKVKFKYDPLKRIRDKRDAKRNR